MAVWLKITIELCFLTLYLVSVPVYVVFLFVLIKYRNDDFRDPFYLFCTSLTVSDILQLIWTQLTWKFPLMGICTRFYLDGGPRLATVLYVFDIFIRKAGDFCIVDLIVNRVTAIVFRNYHEKIWTRRRSWSCVIAQWLLAAVLAFPSIWFDYKWVPVDIGLGLGNGTIYPALNYTDATMYQRYVIAIQLMNLGRVLFAATCYALIVWKALRRQSAAVQPQQPPPPPPARLPPLPNAAQPTAAANGSSGAIGGRRRVKILAPAGSGGPVAPLPPISKEERLFHSEFQVTCAFFAISFLDALRFVWVIFATTLGGHKDEHTKAKTTALATLLYISTLHEFFLWSKPYIFIVCCRKVRNRFSRLFSVCLGRQTAGADEFARRYSVPPNESLADDETSTATQHANTNGQVAPSASSETQQLEHSFRRRCRSISASLENTIARDGTLV